MISKRHLLRRVFRSFIIAFRFHQSHVQAKIRCNRMATLMPNSHPFSQGALFSLAVDGRPGLWRESWLNPLTARATSVAPREERQESDSGAAPSGMEWMAQDRAASTLSLRASSSRALERDGPLTSGRR